jgi:hypothetical protein
MLHCYISGVVYNLDSFWQLKFTQAEWGDSTTYVAATGVEMDFVFFPKPVSILTGLV